MKKITQKDLLFPTVLVLVFNSFANLMDLHRYSYDAYTHMFFASHYMRSWFELWEPRWYGGFPVTSYPPLVHQLNALLGFVFGVEFGYKILCIVSAFMLVFSLYKASPIFLDRVEAKSVGFVSAVLPSLYLTLYVYGQLPTVFASALSFLSAWAFHSYIRNGRRRELAYTVLLCASVAVSHHFTFVFFLPIVLFLAFIMSRVRARPGLKVAVKRSFIAFLFSAGLIFIILEPFLQFIIGAPVQVEIPHATRGNILSGVLSLLFFWGIYGFTVFMIPVGFLIVIKRRELIPLLGTFVFLFLMGLGGLTPIPNLLLGNFWSILTYDRFAIWASFLFSMFLGIMLKDAGRISDKYYQGTKLAKNFRLGGNQLKLTLMLGLVASSFFTLYLDSFMTPRPMSDPLVIQISDFLETNGDYRYITFGLNQGFMKLSMICSSETLDGGYNSARGLQVLTASGIERIDSAIFFPNSTGFLKAFLDQSGKLGVKWAIINKDMDKDHYLFYTGMLKTFEYEVLDEIVSSGYTAEIWNNTRNVSVTEIQIRNNLGNLRSIIWSLCPMLILAAVFAIYFGEKRLRTFDS